MAKIYNLSIFALIGAMLTFLLEDKISGLVITNLFLGGIFGLLISDARANGRNTS